MATFEERFFVESRNPARRLWRDLRLLAHLGGLAWKWATTGRRRRKKYRACEAAGEPYWLD